MSEKSETENGFQQNPKIGKRFYNKFKEKPLIPSVIFICVILLILASGVYAKIKLTNRSAEKTSQQCQINCEPKDDLGSDMTNNKSETNTKNSDDKSTDNKKPSSNKPVSNNKPSKSNQTPSSSSNKGSGKDTNQTQPKTLDKPQQPTLTDFSKYFPNTSMYGSYYLNGKNYTSSPASWAVLWFGSFQPNGYYKMYNSNPADASGDCHWDQFQWTASQLLYSETRDTCGSNDNAVKYSPGISYLPRSWNGQDYQKSGTSIANYYESGQLKCSGTISWTANVYASPVVLAAGVKATHFRSSQTTNWTGGSGSSQTGCHPGATAHYQENLYFITDLPIYGTQNKTLGLKRSVGGNPDTYQQNGWAWDIWFDNWHKLP